MTYDFPIQLLLEIRVVRITTPFPVKEISLRRFAPQRYFLVLYAYFFGGKGVI